MDYWQKLLTVLCLEEHNFKNIGKERKHLLLVIISHNLKSWRKGIWIDDSGSKYDMLLQSK